MCARILYTTFLIFQTTSAAIFHNNVEKKNFCELTCLIPLSLDYQCASNGVSYFNIEELRCAKKLCFPDLELEYPGKCGTLRKGATKIAKAEVKNATTKVCGLDCVCEHSYFPTCGSNGITYGNPCILECSKKCSPGLRKIHPGHCAPAIIFRDSWEDSDFRLQ